MTEDFLTKNNSVFVNHNLANTTKPFYIEEYFFKNTCFKTLSDSFKESFITNVYQNEYFIFLNSFKKLDEPVINSFNLWWADSWFYTYNSIISLTFLITIVFLIGLFLPKTSKGVSVLNVLSALTVILFLFFLPIPHYSAVKTLIWCNYNLYLYIYIIISGIFTAGFLALNNEVTFLKENKHLEYPLLVLLVFLSGIAVIASENFIAVFLALESITLISAVLIGFQRTNNFSTLAGVRYIFFSAVPGGALILGISEIYAYTGAFNFSDIEKLLMNTTLVENSNDSIIGELLYSSLINVLDFSWDIKFQNYSAFSLADINQVHYENNLFNDIISQVEKDSTLAQILNYEFKNHKNESSLDVMLANLGSHIYMDGADEDLNIKRSKYLIYKFIDTYNAQFLTTEFLISWTPKIKNYEGLFNLINDIHNLERSHYYYSTLEELYKGVFNEELFDSIKNNNEVVVDAVVAEKQTDVTQPLQVKKKLISTLVLEDYNRLFEVGKKFIAAANNKENFNETYNSFLETYPVSNFNTKYSVEYLNADADFNPFQTAISTLKYLTNFYHDICSHYEVNMNMTEDLGNFLAKQNNLAIEGYSLPLILHNHTSSLPMIINVSLFLILFYILFKLTAAPFHVWAPAIYEGAPLPIAMFLSIFSKITMVFLLIKLVIFYFYFLYAEWSYLLIISGILSIIVGIYGAISETRIKRFFIYSSMGHVGFMLLGIAEGGIHGIAATFLYLIIYTITVFIGWTILFSSNNKITHINQLSGLSKTNPTLSFILAITMLSMSGIPPLAGFYVKFEILYALVESEFYSIALIALLLTVFSFFYYLRIIKILYFEPTSKYSLQHKLNKTQAFLLAICFLTLVNFSLYFQQPIIYFIKNIIIQTLY